mmetsp:Transcript_10801/g.8053  ORF Transcript_10801/g.8053 Transcript_10801/m.8053 type:complete len:103 (+) Transcript_10801:1517-1825(+)
MAIKVTCFSNLVVCKFKLKEFDSIIGITDQLIDMDPNNTKAYFFRGKALLEKQEFDQAVESFAKLVQIDPNHVEGRNEYLKAKKVRKEFLEDQSKKFSKFFS